ncbi:YbaN family protein [Vibrio hippocampi]|nr:YbaN family protein [Vibrio hippocampi]
MVLNSCGIVAVALGIAGIVLPLLPTTPFLLLASACFLRGSPRLHDWLWNHATFGAIIRDWQQHRCIAKKVKLRGAIFICCSFSVSIFFAPQVWLKIALFVLFLVIFSIFLRIPVKQSVAER